MDSLVASTSDLGDNSLTQSKRGIHMLQVSVALKQQVNQKIQQCVDIIEKNYGVKMRPITVKFDINSARLGGEARYGPNTVRFNPVFLNAHTDKYLNTTVIHEVAHLGVHAVHRGASAHGTEWKRMMIVLGAVPNRCHDYTVPGGLPAGKPKAKFQYNCVACGEVVFAGPKVHANLQAGASYFHKRCGRHGKLVFVNGVGKMSYAAAKQQVIDAAGPKSPTPRTPVPRTPVPRTPVPRSPTPRQAQTKLALCKIIYANSVGVDRASVIELFIKQADCTIAGAATYYATCKRG